MEGDKGQVREIELHTMHELNCSLLYTGKITHQRTPTPSPAAKSPEKAPRKRVGDRQKETLTTPTAGPSHSDGKSRRSPSVSLASNRVEVSETMLRAAARGKSPSWATTGLKKQIWLKEALQEPEFQACVNEIPVEVS